MVAFGGEGGQREVLAYEQLHQIGVGGVEPDRQHGLPGDRRADVGVVHADPRQLADVVEQAAEQQDVGSVDLGEVTLRLRDGLHRVPVDGEGVDGVVLRSRPDRFPGRDPAAGAAGEIERLPHRNQVGSARQHLQQGVPRRGRPRRRQSGGVGPQVVGGDRRQHQAPLGGESPRAQADQRIVGPGRSAQAHLPLVHDQSVVGLDVLGPALPPDEAQHPALGDRLAGRTGRQVDRVPDASGRQADVAVQVVRVGIAELPRDLVDLAGQQPVQRPAGGHVQCVADVEQPLVRPAEAFVRPIGQPGRRERAEHGHVTQPAPRLLEVGLEQVGGVPEGLVPLVEGGEQFRQPAPRVAAPRVEQRRTGSPDQVGVPGDDAQVQQPDARAELAAGDLGAFGRSADGVVDLDLGVPQRVPEVVGQRADPVRAPAPVVQQHQVDVGAWPQFVPGQAAHAGQRCARPGSLRGAGLGEQVEQGRLDAAGEQTPTIRPCRGGPRGPDRDVETLAG